METINFSYYPLRYEELNLGKITTEYCPGCNKVRTIQVNGIQHVCTACRQEWMVYEDPKKIIGGKQFKIDRLNHITG